MKSSYSQILVRRILTRLSRHAANMGYLNKQRLVTRLTIMLSQNVSSVQLEKCLDASFYNSTVKRSYGKIAGVMRYGY